MATHPESPEVPSFDQQEKYPDLERNDISSVSEARDKKPRFQVGDMVRFGKVRDGRPHWTESEMVQMHELKQWRVAEYDDKADTYTLEFQGEGKGRWENIPSEKLENSNLDYKKAEREARIKEAMEKPPGDTVN